MPTGLLYESHHEKNKAFLLADRPRTRSQFSEAIIGFTEASIAECGKRDEETTSSNALPTVSSAVVAKEAARSTADAKATVDATSLGGRATLEILRAGSAYPGNSDHSILYVPHGQRRRHSLGCVFIAADRRKGNAFSPRAPRIMAPWLHSIRYWAFSNNALFFTASARPSTKSRPLTPERSGNKRFPKSR